MTMAFYIQDGTIALVDLVAGREGRRIPTGDKEGRTLCFSPDGRALASYVVPSVGFKDRRVFSRETVWETSFIHLWDVATGREINRLPAHSVGPKFDLNGYGGPGGVGLWVDHLAQGTSLSFAPDGRTLASTSVDEDRIRVWDLANGKERFPDRSPWVPLGTFFFTPDGKTLIAGGRDGSLHVFDARTGVPRRTIDAHGNRVGDIALTADGRTLISIGESGPAKFWDAATGRELRRLTFTRDFSLDTLILSDDGRTLLTGAPLRRLVDLTTGRERAMLPAHSDCKAPYAARFAPGGRTVWVSYGDYLLECDAETGRQLRRIEPPVEGDAPCKVQTLALSPDGRRIALGHKQIHLLEASTGREVARLVAPQRSLDRGGLAFTPDGRLLAATYLSDHRSRSTLLWEVASGQLLTELTRPHRFDFADFWADAWDRQIISPDGRLLVTYDRNSDDSPMIWDLASLMEDSQQKDRPRAADPESLWADLSGDNAPGAYRSLLAMADDPVHTVPLLSARLKPTEPADPRQVARWIAELGSDRYVTLEAAMAGLEERIGEIGPALQKGLKAGPGAEARQRLEALLAASEGFVRSGEVLRQLRAIAVLERIGTEDARRVVERLSSGAEGSRTTREARSTLARMRKQRVGE
jgi:WD40 repeat protein